MNAERRLPDDLLARGFAEHLVSWANQQAAVDGTTAAMLRHVAIHLSLAGSSGHVCARLADIAAALPPWTVADLRVALLGCGVVGTAADPGALPLILDAQDRLYLHRYFDYEQRLARRLMQPRMGLPVIAPAVARRLDDLFAANAAKLAGRPDWQKIAAALALLRPLTIISGGPGTGKTTTVVKLLACLLEQDPDCRIALAAPTGKAAARMLDALRQRASHLPAPMRERLPTDSFTIHRLLGVTPTSGQFRHRADNQLPIDVLVVDEASMLDLALATHLVEAVPKTAKIILLGDKDQLAAVESGAVFAELSADPTLDDACCTALAALTGTARELMAPPTTHVSTVLHDSVVWFTENFRFEKTSGIGRLAAAINAGDADTLLVTLGAGDDPAINWIDSAEPALDPAAMQAIITGYAGYVQAVGAATTPATLFAAFNDFRVLCAVRHTPRGVKALNKLIGTKIRSTLGHPHDPGLQSPWYPGRPIMVLQNDYVLKVFNGDIGIVFPDAQGNLMVYFEDGPDNLRAVAPVRLPDHDTAFAMTVHKAQGSEFGNVLLCLPAESSRVLTRELLYTAVTRSKKNLTLLGSTEVLREAVSAQTVRYSGLATQLALARDRAQ